MNNISRRPIAIFIALFINILLGACSHSGQKHNAGSMKKNILSFQEENLQFDGDLLLPKEFSKPVPVVLVVHEWWGKTPFMYERAKKLNEAGYAALVVDLFGNNQIGSTPDEAKKLATPFYQDAQLGITRLNKFLELVKKDPNVDATKVFAIGHCFGGTQVLNLARAGSSLKGVASFHGGLESSLKANKKMNQVKVAVYNGAVDPMVPEKQVTAFKKEMKNAKFDFSFHNYQGATHAFTNPGATEVGKKYGLPVAYDEKADKESFAELLKFLAKNI